MIPNPWMFILLALLDYRICRLVGWDDFPPVAKARAWVVGERVVRVGTGNQHMNLTSTEVDEDVGYKRPTLEHFLHCPFCFGFWLCVATTAAWAWAGAPGHVHYHSWVAYPALPFALNGLVGIIARNLDP